VNDPASVVLRYFEALDGGDFSQVASSFAERAVYVVPSELRPFERPTAPRRLAVRRGRREIGEQLAERGALPLRHLVDRVVVNGRQVWVLGSVVPHEGAAAQVVFASVATLDDDGRIVHYLTLSEDAEPLAIAEILG